MRGGPWWALKLTGPAAAGSCHSAAGLPAAARKTHPCGTAASCGRREQSVCSTSQCQPPPTHTRAASTCGKRESLHELGKPNVPGQEAQRAVHRTKLEDQLRVRNLPGIWSSKNTLWSQREGGRKRDRERVWAPYKLTSEDNVQHGDADVPGSHGFALYRAAQLLGCLDDALLPVLRGQQLHCGPTRHN